MTGLGLMGGLPQNGMMGMQGQGPDASMQQVAERGPRVHPRAQALVAELAQRAGVSMAKEIQSMPPGTRDFSTVYAKIIEAARGQAATDMEVESVEQISRMWGIPSPYERSQQPQQPQQPQQGGQQQMPMMPFGFGGALPQR